MALIALLNVGLLAGLCAQSSSGDKTLVSIYLTKTETISRNLFAKIIGATEKQAGTMQSAAKSALLGKQIEAMVVAQQADSEKVTLTKEESPTDVNDPQVIAAAAANGVSPKELIDMNRIQKLGTKFLQIKQAQLGATPDALSREENNFHLVANDYMGFYKQNLLSFYSPLLVQYNALIIDTGGMTAEQVTANRKSINEDAALIKGSVKAFDDLVKRVTKTAQTSYKYLDSMSVVEGMTGQTQAEKDFIKAVLALKKGEVSQVLDTGSTLMLVAVKERREKGIVGYDDPILIKMPGIDDAKDTPKKIIRKNLILKAYMESYIRSLLAKADIKIFAENINW